MSEPDIQFGLVPRWLLDARPSDRAVSLYAHLAATFDTDSPDAAYAGVEWLALHCGKSESWIKRGMKELVELGAVTRSRRMGTSSLTTVHRLPLEHRGYTNQVENDISEYGIKDPLSRPSNYPDQDISKRVCDQGSDSSPTTKKETPKDTPAGFAEFWAEYRPHRNSRKQDAARAFEKAVKRDGLSAVGEGLAAWITHWETSKTETRFIPHAATWLNKGDYLDPPPTAKDPNLFTDEQRAAVLAAMRELHPEEISRRTRENEYPYDRATLERMGE